jgi:molybdopterin synthase catalytic subunit
MRIRTLFFASYKELVGTGELWLDLPAGSTVSDAVREIRGKGRGFDILPDEPAVAVNRTYAAAAHPLAEGDELAFIPPVAGG